MNWISWPDNKPKESQPYLISITIPHRNGDYTYNYIGYYDAETGHWHKYEATSEESVKERITDKINGWVQLTTYLG